MSAARRLALGTVQFGLPYGARRRSAAITESEAREILAAAWTAGVDMLDTAPVYGAAEQVIAACRPKTAEFQIITKTIALPKDMPRQEAVGRVLGRVRESARILAPLRLYAVLVHHEQDLLGEAGDTLFAELQALREQGAVGKIGVSVYAPESLEAIVRRHQIEIAQVPFNVFDQRFADAALVAKMADRKVELHARSIYLQGYLLRDPQTYPQHLAELRDPARRFEVAASDCGLSRAEACIAAALGIEAFSRLVIGSDCLADFAQTLAAVTKAETAPNQPDWRAHALSTAATDPRNWPR